MIYVDPEIKKMLCGKRLVAARQMAAHAFDDESAYRFRAFDEALDWIESKEKADSADDTDGQ